MLGTELGATGRLTHYTYTAGTSWSLYCLLIVSLLCVVNYLFINDLYTESMHMGHIELGQRTFRNER